MANTQVEALHRSIEAVPDSRKPALLKDAVSSKNQPLLSHHPEPVDNDVLTQDTQRDPVSRVGSVDGEELPDCNAPVRHRVPSENARCNESFLVDEGELQERTEMSGCSMNSSDHTGLESVGFTDYRDECR